MEKEIQRINCTVMMKLLLNKFVNCKYVLLSLVNKKADWLIAGQVGLKWENQTEKTLGRRRVES